MLNVHGRATRKVSEEQKPSHDPNCYLCPRNKRITGEPNPDYHKPYVFKNDFSALLEDTPAPEQSADPLFQMSQARGESRVICFHQITAKPCHY